MRALLTKLCALAVLTLAIATSVPAHVAAQPVDQLQLTKTTRLTPRLSELDFTAETVGPTSVRVLVPAHFDASGRTRYPVLYLLHGGGGDRTDWSMKGNAEAATASYPFIVVMTDTSHYGTYSDWWNYGRGGKPMWETYHVKQLVPWIDAHYPTIADRGRRAIAGLSMGGGGAMGLAAHHPDVFGAAAAFSGAVDTNTLPVQLLVETSGYEDMRMPGSLFGHRADNEVRWRGSNPWDLAVNLQNMSLELDTGNGLPGGPGGDLGDPVEGAVHEMMVNLHDQLTNLALDHVWNDYGPGGHNWFYWSRDLTQLLPRLSALWAQPIPEVTHFDFKTILNRYDVYGWHVGVARRALEFSQLTVAPNGFSLTGSGRATVITPPSFAPGAKVTARIADGGRPRTLVLVADRAGRVTVPLSLGRPNPVQQFTAQGNAWAAAHRNAWPSVTADVSLYPTEGGKATATPSPRPRTRRR